MNQISQLISGTFNFSAYKFPVQVSTLLYCFIMHMHPMAKALA